MIQRFIACISVLMLSATLAHAEPQTTIAPISGTFTQTIHLGGISAPLESNGIFHVYSGDSFLLSYQQPFAYYRLFSGNHITTFDEDATLQSDETLPDNYNMALVMKPLLSQNITQSLEGQTVFTVQQADAIYTLTPTAAELKQLITAIIIEEASDHNQITINKAGGDKEVWTVFFDVQYQPLTAQEQAIVAYE